jgi:hypothetical protein
LLLCWPVAIASVVFSTQVNSKWVMGDVAGAQNASQKAKKLAILSAVLWVVSLVVWVIGRLALAGMSGSGSAAGH